MTAERRWLVDCLRALARGATLPVASASIDWTALLATAEAESVAPALGFMLKKAPPSSVPPAVATRLDRVLAEGTAGQLLLGAELGRLLKVFKREAIAVMPLKGPALAERFYRHPTLRPCTDLDLLIRPDSVLQVDELLRLLGFRRFDDAHTFAFDVAYDRAVVYETTAGVRVDLHWGLLSDPRYAWNESEADGIWQRAMPTRVGGEEALTLCPEDLLLYLTVHVAVHHALVGLLWLYDLYLLLEREAETLDWTALEQRAGRWRVRSALYFGLREVQQVFGTQVPAPVMAALRPAGPRAHVVARLLRSRAPAQRHALEHLIAVLLVDRGLDVARTLGGVLVPSPAWVQARYGSVARSRLGQYAAHVRRLGQVVRESTHGLGRARR
jgi:putative nucleotidyltransferase-like protein